MLAQGSQALLNGPDLSENPLNQGSSEENKKQVNIRFNLLICKVIYRN